MRKDVNGWRTCPALALEGRGAADPVLHQQAHASAGIVAALLHQARSQQPQYWSNQCTPCQGLAPGIQAILWTAH